jgi:MFS family permease
MILSTTLIPGEFNVGFVTAVLSTFMYEISAELSLTSLQIGLVLSTFPAAMAVFGVISGTMADKFGPARMFGIGMILATIAALARSFVGSFEMLFALSFASYTGVALAIPSITKMIGLLFDPDSQGIAIGTTALGYRLGSASVLFAAPLLLSAFTSWRIIFLMYGGLGALVTCFYHYVARSGSLYNLRSSGRQVKDSLLTSLAIVMNVKAVKAAAISRFFLGGFIMSLSSFLPFVLQVTGSSILYTAILAGIFWACQAAGAFLVPVLSDRVRKRASLVVYFGVFSFFLVMVLVYAWDVSVWRILIFPALGFIFAGLTEIMWLIPLANPRIRVNYVGVSTGILMCLGSVGGVISSVILGFLIGMTRGVELALSFLAILSLLMAVTALPAMRNA